MSKSVYILAQLRFTKSPRGLKFSVDHALGSYDIILTDFSALVSRFYFKSCV